MLFVDDGGLDAAQAVPAGSAGGSALRFGPVDLELEQLRAALEGEA
jgi:hypothetical protein